MSLRASCVGTNPASILIIAGILFLFAGLVFGIAAIVIGVVLITVGVILHLLWLRTRGAFS